MADIDNRQILLLYRTLSLEQGPMAGQALKASLSECPLEDHMDRGKPQFNSNKEHPWQQERPQAQEAKVPVLEFSHLVWLEGYSDRQPLRGWLPPVR